MIYNWLVERVKIYICYLQGSRNVNCFKNIYSEKLLKNYTKLFRSSFPEMLQTFFTQRALQGHSQGTLSALGHSSTWALEGHSRHLVLGQLSTSDTRTHEGHLGTQSTLFSRLHQMLQKSICIMFLYSLNGHSSTSFCNSLFRFTHRLIMC